MIGDDIDVDKLLDDIEQQLEILTAIAADNAILNEQLRLLHEAREIITTQGLEIERLAELIDPDDLEDYATLSTRRGNYAPDQEADDQ